MLGPLRRCLNRLIVPRTLFGRSLLIVVVPLLILQILLTYIFYNRHWDTVTRWLAFGVAGEVALLAETIEEAPRRRPPATRFIERARRSTDLNITLRARRHASAEARGGGRHRRDRRRPHRHQDPRRRSRSGCPTRSRSTCATRRPGPGGRLRPARPRPAARCIAARKRVTSTTTWLLLGLDGRRLDRAARRSRSTSCACRSGRSASSPAPPTASARAATSATSARGGRSRSARRRTPST